MECCKPSNERPIVFAHSLCRDSYLLTVGLGAHVHLPDPGRLGDDGSYPAIGPRRPAPPKRGRMKGTAGHGASRHQPAIGAPRRTTTHRPVTPVRATRGLGKYSRPGTKMIETVPLVEVAAWGDFRPESASERIVFRTHVAANGRGG